MKNNWVIILFGLSLFFLVMSIFYTIIVANPDVDKIPEVFAPFIILSGFFIFLIGAVLFALGLHKIILKELHQQ